MPVQIGHVVIGGGTVASMAGLLRYLQRKRPKAENASEGNAWHEALLGIGQIRQTLLRVETAVAILPSLREDVDRHDVEIRSLRNDTRVMRDDLLDIRREADDRDAKIIRLTREIRNGD